MHLGYHKQLHRRYIRGVKMMDAVRTSETSVYSSEATRRYIPEDSHLHTQRRENLISPK
jgi:hypothetical protein